MTSPVDRYRIFDVERRGDTAIVTCRADPVGFPTGQLRDELRRLAGEFGPCRRNLILDLGGPHYPGTAVLMAVDALITEVRGRGGNVAVADASDETLRVLREYHFDERWPTYYPTREAAIAAVVRESWCERTWRHRRAEAVLLALVALPLLAAGAAFALAPTAEHAVLREVEDVWADHQRLRRRAAAGHEPRRLLDEVYALRGRMNAARIRLTKVESAPPELRKAVDDLIVLIGRDGDPEVSERQAFEARLDAARRAVEVSDGAGDDARPPSPGVAGVVPQPPGPAGTPTSDEPARVEEAGAASDASPPASVETAPETVSPAADETLPEAGLRP